MLYDFAVSAGLALATSDPHCAALLQAEGGQVLALPDSTGTRPTPLPPSI